MYTLIWMPIYWRGRYCHKVLWKPWNTCHDWISYLYVPSSRWCFPPLSHFASCRNRWRESNIANKACANTRHMFTVIKIDDWRSKQSVWLNNLPPFPYIRPFPSRGRFFFFLNSVQQKTIVWPMPRLAKNIYRSNLWSASRAQNWFPRLALVFSVFQNFHLA